MTNKQVAQAFADGATKGKSGTMFIEGDMVYSYGHHFIIAKRTGHLTALFTDAGYSPTTARHKGYVRRALLSAGYDLRECAL